MRIFYTGSIHTSWLSTCLLRMNVLKELGHEVIEFDHLPYNYRGGKFLSRVYRRLKWGPPIFDYNRDMLKLATETQPDVVWVDKGIWLFPETIQKMKALGAKIVHYTPDPALCFHKSRFFLRSVPHYDLVVTTKRYEIDLFHEMGVKELMVQYPMFYPEVHVPPDPSPDELAEQQCDAVFIGTFTPDRYVYINPLIEAGLDVRIYGNQWERCKDPILRKGIAGGPHSGRDYNLRLACGRLALGLLSPLVPDTSTTRSVEIPAVGGFFFAQRTDEHKEMFEEDKEAVFFDSVGEMMEKATYYLNHPEERLRIAQAGLQRTRTSPYDGKSQISQVVEAIKSL